MVLETVVTVDRNSYVESLEIGDGIGFHFVPGAKALYAKPFVPLIDHAYTGGVKIIEPAGVWILGVIRTVDRQAGHDRPFLIKAQHFDVGNGKGCLVVVSTVSKDSGGGKEGLRIHF